MHVEGQVLQSHQSIPLTCSSLYALSVKALANGDGRPIVHPAQHHAVMHKLFKRKASSHLNKAEFWSNHVHLVLNMEERPRRKAHGRRMAHDSICNVPLGLRTYKIMNFIFRKEGKRRIDA